MDRKLDGMFFRIMRDGKACNVCVSDMTAEEQDSLFTGQSPEYLRKVIWHLSDALHGLGDQFDLRGGYDD